MFRVEALYKYNSNETDELGLVTGELLQVISTEDDPWWLCKSSTGAIGLAPSNYLKSLARKSSNILLIDTYVKLSSHQSPSSCVFSSREYPRQQRHHIFCSIRHSVFSYTSEGRWCKDRSIEVRSVTTEPEPCLNLTHPHVSCLWTHPLSQWLDLIWKRNAIQNFVRTSQPVKSSLDLSTVASPASSVNQPFQARVSSDAGSPSDDDGRVTFVDSSSSRNLFLDLPTDLFLGKETKPALGQRNIPSVKFPLKTSKEKQQKLPYVISNEKPQNFEAGFRYSPCRSTVFYPANYQVPLNACDPPDATLKLKHGNFLLIYIWNLHFFTLNFFIYIWNFNKSVTPTCHNLTQTFHNLTRTKCMRMMGILQNMGVFWKART